MYSPETQISVLQSRRERINSKLKKFEKEVKDTLHVNCRENLNEYLYNSTLHGLRYVGDRSISRFERLIFTVFSFSN